MATFQKKRSPARWPGVMHKLAGWVLLNSTTVAHLLLLAVLLAALVWQGVQHGY